MKKLLLIAFSILTCMTSYAQIITTIAGGLGDGGIATNTSINNPFCSVVDTAGNIYISDGSRVRKIIASTGKIITVAGGGSTIGDGVQAKSAMLANVQGLAIDRSGNIYFAESGDAGGLSLWLVNRIRKISSITGIITTVAGKAVNVTPGFSGDGGLATLAKLNNPSSLALDAYGNIYIYDGGNNRVRKITLSTGIISTVAGNGSQGYSGDGGLANAASFTIISGLALDSLGNIYIADYAYGRIRKVTKNTGIINTIAGKDTSGYSGDGGLATLAKLANVQGLAIDRSGNIYFADGRFLCSPNRIRKVTVSTGIINTIAGIDSVGFSGDGGLANLAKFNNIRGVSLDLSGNIYIAEYSSSNDARLNSTTNEGRLRKITASNQIINTVAGNGIGIFFDSFSDRNKVGFGGDGEDAKTAVLNHPKGVVLDNLGNIYISDNGNNRIRKITASTGIISTVAGNGTQGYSGDGGLATLAMLGMAMVNVSSTNALAIDKSGNIYIADYGNNRIRKVNVSTGIITTVAGNGTQGYSGDGGLATLAMLGMPTGIVLDNFGNIYFAEIRNSCVRKVTVNTGIITTVAGDGSWGSPNETNGDGKLATSAQIFNPQGIALDDSNNIYIAEYGRIRKVTASTGIINPIAGTIKGGINCDGCLAITSIINPSDVNVDKSGNIYISDYGSVIRKVVTATGIITTIAGIDSVGFSGDGGLATLAKLNNPQGFAIDASGNIYFADASNNRIRKITSGTSGIRNIDIEGKQFNIYPNPATSEIHIETSESEKLTAQLFDITGKDVTPIIPFVNSADINTQSLMQGLYFVKIINENTGIVNTHKVLIVK